MAGTTSIKLPDPLKEKISDLAKGVAQTPHAYMVEAIAEKVARDEKRQSLLESAVESERQLRKTGIAYTHEEVAQYARDRAAGKKVKRPRPIRIPRAER